MASAFNRTFKSSIASHLRSYSNKPHRYTGYINKLMDDKSKGHAVRHNQPQNEYLFCHSDFIVDPASKSKFRPYVYQEIEFSIFESKPINIATNITALNNKPLINTHQNLFIPRSVKTKHLLDESDAIHHRHRGVVFQISEDGEQGLIMPDKLYCNALHFYKRSIQSTGIQRVFMWSEVEFDVKQRRKESEFHQAVCITRPRGQIITAEYGILGNRRRYLASLYKKSDTYASLSAEYHINRKRGYIAHVEQEKLYGFILIFDNDTDTDALLHVHIDECHMFGARKLRRFQEVEFIISTNHETGRRMATNVTAPDMKILHYHSDNHFVSTSVLRNTLDVHQRHKGIVTKIPHNNAQEPYIIKPNQYSYRPVIAYHPSLVALGSKYLQRGDAVEFRINDNLSAQHEALQRAFDVTAEGGHPLLLQDGEYGKYLQTKIDLESKQKLLPEYGDNEEHMYDVHGFIASYNKESHYGFIEIIAPKDVRYKRMFFKMKDVVLKDKKMDYRKYQPHHTAQNKVIFTVIEAREINEFVKDKQLRVTKKAINIVTEGKNYFDLREIKTKDRNYKSLSESTDGERRIKKKILKESMFAQCVKCKAWKHESFYSKYEWKAKALHDRKCKACIGIGV